MHDPDDPGDESGGDPFEDIDLDENFVRGATRHEPPAYVRMARAIDAREAYDEFTARRLADLRNGRLHRRLGRGVRRILRPRTLVGIIGVTALVALALRPAFTTGAGPAAWLSGAPVRMTMGDGRPTPVSADSDVPLGRPQPVDNPTDGYAFMFTQDAGTDPVAYDPCRRISVVTNEASSPQRASGLLQEALAEVSEVTGLQFVIEGATGEVPVQDRPAFQPERYGDRWAPVLIAWTDPDELPVLDGPVAGIGGSTSVKVSSNPAVYVSGMVALDGPQLDEMLGRRNGRDQARSVIMHELGHLVGLDHIDGRDQLMAARGNPRITTFRDGDLTGLARLGTGPCVGRI